MDKKTYSKNDISKILNKASAIQTQKDLYGDKDGLTEEELISIAQEVGIEKDSLFEALFDLENSTSKSKFNWISGTSTIQSSSMIKGEFDEKHWDDIVQEIRLINGGIGKNSKIGASYEWEQRMKEIGYKHISFTPKNGKTKIQFAFGWNGLKLLTSVLPTFFAFIIALIILKGIGLPKNVAVLYAPIASIFGFGFGRLYLKSYFDKQKLIISDIQKSVGKLIDKINTKAPKITIEEDVYTSNNQINNPPTKITE